VSAGLFRSVTRSRGEADEIAFRGTTFDMDPQIFVVSDSTGETAERVVRAALLQFPHHRVRLRLFTRVRDEAAATDVLHKAGEAGAMVVFTL